MSKTSRLATPVHPPVELAVVLVCEKCGKRARGSAKNPSHQLASKIKRLAKHEFERGQIRTTLTSCVDLCPEERITVAVVPVTQGVPQFLEVDFRDIDATSRAVLSTIRRLTARRAEPGESAR